jgi:hypothetical protein
MRLGASKPEPTTANSNPPEIDPITEPKPEAPATPAQVEKRNRTPLKILFAETIGADGTFTPAHEAELAKISERAREANGKDPGFKQKQFTDWHGWCHWRASFARIQATLHQADADRWEARKKGRDLDREQSIKAKIEAEVRKINEQRAKLGKAPLTAEQAAVLLS